MNSPLISIIVPCYRQAQYLSEALESVLAQTYNNWECIVIDDGSPDSTREIAEEYAGRDFRIKYMWQSNQGLPLARNNGIRFSHGEYILPLDADDIIAPTYIEKCVSHMQTDNACKLVYCRAEFFGARTGEWHLKDYQFDNLIWDNCIFCSALFRRVDFERVGGYNPNMKSGLEDWDFWLSLLRPGDKVVQIDEVLFYYRIKEVSMSTQVIDIRPELFRQIVHNHPELYSKHLENILWWHSMAQETESLIERIKAIYSSRTYKLGHLLTFPIRLFKKI